ncbi:Ig domain-containing protein [Parabacteroides distasonis]|uniref:Ig domain-containing protein n=1 Tax=Parabacteroides distasonis TaxID=823 RepID=A0A5C6KJ06_PARDI|nr:Ig-like domain-containing protein [Parabacteroides distasonis]TWV63362.1 Ig domain-containing protein [Parabacteroides distasonis]
MRKLISAVFLALMALIQVHAQDSDLRSAPDLPTFKVTLNYSASEGGTITSDISSGAKVAYNTAHKFTITANAGYVLADITMNTATIGTLPTGTFNGDNTTTYTYTSPALAKATEIKATFKAKDPVTVTMSPASATLDEVKAKVNLPKLAFTPEDVTGYTVKYKNVATGTETTDLPVTVGKYNVLITKAETATQAAIDKKFDYEILPAHTLTYTFEATQGTVAATMNGTAVTSGGEIAYDKPAVLKITAKSGYVLGKLTVDNQVVNLPEGTFDATTKVTTYAAYTTANLKTAMSINVEFTAKKTVSVSASPLSATRDEIAADKNLPTVTFTPSISGQKYQFKNASGTLMDKLPATDGVYTIVATSPETADYAALTDESNKFTISQANKLSWSVEGEQGTVTAKMGDKDVANGGDIVNGKTAVLTITAKPGYKLSEIKIDGKPANLPTGKFNSTDNTISYTYTTGELTASATINVVFTEKMKVTAKVTGSSATKDQVVAKQNLPVIKFTPEMNGQAVTYRAVNSKETKDLPAEVGVYKIVLISPETMEYAALTDSSNTFTVTGANALVYAVGEHGTVTAKMDGKDVVSGGDIAYGKAAVFSIVSNSNYKLGAIKQGSSDVDISKIAGTYADGKTSYTYTTSELTAGAGYTFVFISKDTVKFVANNLTQMEGSIKQVTVASDIKDIEIEYQVNGTNWIKELPSTLKAGSYKARFTRPEDLTYRSLSDTATLVVESKKEVSISKLPDAGYIEEGEPLSIAVLQGGSVEGTTGSFVWTNPNDTVSLTKTKYSITFMPDDPILYLAKDTFINVKVTPVYTMKVTAANFGTVKLTGRSANDRYAEGYELAAEAIADKNYTFAGWSDGNTSAIRTLTATKDLELVARFDSILHKVNIGTPANGTLEVYANGVEVKDGEALLQGTLLTINATPTDKKHMMVKSVKVNGALVNTGSYTLAQAATIEASFEEKPAATHLVNVSNSGHGSVTLLDNKSKAPITPGAAIAEGVIVKVICKADYGYALNSVNVENAADSSTDNTFTVGTADANVKVNFGLTQFKVTAAANIPTAGSVSLTKVEDNATVTSGSDVNYQTRLVATVTTNSGYRFKSMTANSSEIKDGDTLVVSGPMTIAANYIGKTKLEINTAQQSLVYNKQPRSYEVKVKGGHAAKGFQVTYSKNGVSLGETLPQDAGTYTVNITRPEDDLYKAVSETATLVINKAGMALKSVPTLNGNDVTAELTQDIADIAWNPGSVSTLSKLRAAATGTPTNNEVNVIRFTPKDKNNYEPVDYYIAVGEVEPVTLTTKDTYVTNGGLEVTSTEIAKGTKLTLKAIAPEGQRFVKWKEDNDTNIEREVTMNADATYTPVFEALKTLSIKNRLIEKSYDGAIQVVSLSELFNETGLPENEIVLKYANVDGSSATPMNAGTYMVNVSFAGNDEWKEFYDVNIKLVIKPATINSFTPLTASELTEGQPLSASILSGGVASTASTNGTTVAGIFEWAEPNKIPGVGDDQSYKVEFTSYDPNYSNNETNAKVTVKSTGASVITFEQPENGTLKVYTVDESGEQTEINSGTAVAPGSKLIVEVEPAKGYELENLQIGEKSYTSNSAQIDNVEGSLAIIATMKESTPDTPVVPDVRVTGVKLNVTSKSIAVGESFVLKATVSPSNATMQSVSWSSSDETVATVDADGIVTALKVGSCKITVATDDGNKTATCDVSVSTTVSIEQIAEGIRVYGIHGAVMVEPTAPVSIRIFAVTGNCLYSGNVSDITRIPAPAGIYLIELSANGRHAATKVSVR